MSRLAKVGFFFGVFRHSDNAESVRRIQENWVAVQYLWD